LNLTEELTNTGFAPSGAGSDEPDPGTLWVSTPDPPVVFRNGVIVVVRSVIPCGRMREGNDRLSSRITAAVGIRQIYEESINARTAILR
jgi:hypothetical protein